MLLYKIFNNIILEECLNNEMLFEAIAIDDIEKILAGDNGKFYHVTFDYDDGNGNISNRFVQIHQRNISTIGNDLIDAYQISRDGRESGLNTRTGKIESFEGWKKFNLKKMSNFRIYKLPFYKSKPKFNPTGNNSSSVASTPTIANFNYQYSPNTIKNKTNKSNTIKPSVDNKPKKQNNLTTPEQKPKTLRPMKRINTKTNPIEPENLDDIEFDLDDLEQKN